MGINEPFSFSSMLITKQSLMEGRVPAALHLMRVSRAASSGRHSYCSQASSTGRVLNRSGLSTT